WNNIAKATAATSNAGHCVHNGIGGNECAAGTMCATSQICAAAMVPNVSFRIVAAAPAKSATPEARCWLVSSRTALVSDMPGTSTISADSTTSFSANGSSQALTIVAMKVATSAAIASLAADRRGRP